MQISRTINRDPSNIKLPAVSLKNKSALATKYSLDVNHKKIAFQKLIDEAKYAENGEIFSKNIIQALCGKYNGDNGSVLKTIFESLRLTTREYFHLNEFSSELQHVLAIVYIKIYKMKAFQAGEFNFIEFKEWCNGKITQNDIKLLDEAYFQDITCKDNKVIFSTPEYVNSFQFDSLELNPNLDNNKLSTLAHYQLLRIINHPQVSNLTLARIARLPNLSGLVEPEVSKTIENRLELELSKSGYPTYLQDKIRTCFKLKDSELNLSYSHHRSAVDKHKSGHKQLTEMPSNQILLLLPHLKKFNLKCNNINELGNALDNLEQLQELNLMSNKLTDKVFNCPPNLETLDLSNNMLKQIEINGVNLKHLNLSDNKLQEIYNITNCKNLETLNLNKNLLTKIDAICNFTKLSVLILNNNQISFLPRDVFKHTSELTQLEISGNSFSTLDAECFNDLLKLKILNLSFNKTTTINQAFTMPCLQVLDLSNNMLTADQLYYLRLLNNLEVLHLNANMIAELNPDTLQSSCISKVSLGSNPKIFDNCTIMKFLGGAYYGIYVDVKDRKWFKSIDGNLEINIGGFNQLVFNQYMKNNPSAVYDKHYLELLNVNKLRDPDILTKLVTRIFNGEVDIAYLQKDINFFTPLSKYTNVSLLSLIAKNFNYFIKSKDDMNALSQVFANELLIQVQDSEIDQMIQKELLCHLQQIIGKQNIELEKSTVDYYLRITKDGKLMKYVNDYIRNKIRYEFINKSQVQSIQNLTNLQLDKIIAIIRNKSSYSLQLLKDYIGGESLDLDDAELNNFVRYLNVVQGDLDNIQIEAIAVYNQMSSNNSKVLNSTLNQYLNWPEIIKERKKMLLNEVFEFEQAIVKLKNFTFDIGLQDLYGNYILNTLPYSTYANINNLIKSQFVPEGIKEKLRLVELYKNYLELDDEAMTMVLILSKKNTNINYLLEFSVVESLSINNRKKLLFKRCTSWC